MPAPFKQITLDQFAELLSSFPFKRRINAVHMHHTWRPDRAAYGGHDTIVAMWRYHTQENHWSDIAQHITIAPDGTIWLGRDWNRPPASASGHNGNEQAGPFMFEMIGDFDRGRDPFDGPQRRTALEVIARVQQRFRLSPGTLQFHNMMSAKSCPGSGIDYQEVLAELAHVHTQLPPQARDAQADGPFPRDRVETPRWVLEAIEDLQRDTGRAIDPPDAEPCAHGARGHGYDAGAMDHADDRDDARRIPGNGSRAIDIGAGASRGIAFDAADLQSMRPHVVNLRMGRFSSEGAWRTSRQDVDAMFDDDLHAAWKAARAQDRPLRLMFYAHGGLTSEADALDKVRERIGWWAANDIYPIYFVWETGLAETLRQMLERHRQDRGVFSDLVGDPLIEDFAHRAGGVQIWSAMKASAQASAAPNVEGGPADAATAVAGGAWYVARKLAAFCKTHEDVELHAVGHSAGAIFHAHFIPCALAHGVPAFHSLHLMAPAVRVDLFRQQLEGRVGAGVDRLTMYTMQDTYEKQDKCDFVYRKSLLYLINRALEPDVGIPILGLERCVRDDAGLKTLFGIGAARTRADIVWSDNQLDQGRSASRARAHGDFDDDPATMGSIVRRILDLKDADRIVEMPRPRRIVDPWHAANVDWAPDGAWGYAASAPAAPAAAPGWPVPGLPPARVSGAMPAMAPALAAAGWPPASAGAGAGQRSALCVGIDDYPTAPLGGCVNDARAWSDALQRLGFRTTMLADGEATRDAIVSALMTLVGNSAAGDVIVFQYAGHGTQMPDLDGDERDDGDQEGHTPDQDEALCPYDFASGELLVDDDIRAIFRRLPDGVNLTCFFDCCHSGTITRFAVGSRPGADAPAKRARFIPASRTLIANYVAKRKSMGRFRGVPPTSLEAMREVVFSACLSSEVALEAGGHGDFTRHAMEVFAGGVAGLSNDAFADRVTQAFGAAPQQHAKLYSSDAGRVRPLLQPLLPAPGVPARGRAVPAGPSPVPAPDLAVLAAELVRVSQLLVR